MSWAIVAFVTLSIGTGQALIIHHPDYTTDTLNPPMYAERPGDDFGWDHVGQVNNDSNSNSGSGVYLGHGWVLGANHVGPGSLVLHGTTYLRDTSEPVVRLDNPGREDKADLILFKVQNPPGLPPMTIAQSSPAVNTGVAMAGTGRTRGSALKTYNLPPPSEGYDWRSTRVLTWGTNNVSGSTAFDDAVDGEFNTNTHLYTADFNSVAGNAQGTIHDSGGGVFTWEDDAWVLSGVMISALFRDSGDPAVYYSVLDVGDKTAIADLSVYRDQIIATIPEPSTLVFMGAGVLLFLFRRRFGAGRG